MNSYTILTYILKSIFISGVFTGYYWLALRNKSFNYYNRFYLLLSIISSFIIPLFNFTWFTIEKAAPPVTHQEITPVSIQISHAHSTVIPWLSILNYTVIGISLALLAMFMLNIYKVYKLKRRSPVFEMDGIHFIYTNLEHAPFSFLNNLFWKESISMDSTYGQKIFKHEVTHIRQKHTLDILFTQVVNAIFWMNPFNWLMQKELKAIHEFIADKEAIGNNDVEEFARLLLQAHYGNHFLNPTHLFYYSSIKRRLIMLSTTHRTKFSYLRRVLALPISVMAIAALSVSTIESRATPGETPLMPNVTLQPIGPVVNNDTTVEPVKLVLQPGEKAKKQHGEAGPEVKMIAYKVSGNVNPPNNDKQQPQLSATAEKIIFVADTTLRPDMSIRMADEVKIERLKDSSATKGIPVDVLYFYDGRFIPYEEVTKLNPTDIKSINVWKGESAIKKFGQIGAKGVIELFSKKLPN